MYVVEVDGVGYVLIGVEDVGVDVVEDFEFFGWVWVFYDFFE